MTDPDLILRQLHDHSLGRGWYIEKIRELAAQVHLLARQRDLLIEGLGRLRDDIRDDAAGRAAEDEQLAAAIDLALNRIKAMNVD